MELYVMVIFCPENVSILYYIFPSATHIKEGGQPTVVIRKWPINISGWA